MNSYYHTNCHRIVILRQKTKNCIFKGNKNGFYVYAKPNQCNPKQIADYIGRYLGRPVIATKRIDKYDGEEGFYIFPMP